MSKITWIGLRQLGFRLITTQSDARPHMLCSVNPHEEVGLEIAPYTAHENKWCMWLRSDMAGSKARFCYIKSVETLEEVRVLIEAITGKPVEYHRTTPERESEIMAAVEQEKLDCLRRRNEYLKDDRWCRVPGGL